MFWLLACAPPPAEPVETAAPAPDPDEALVALDGPRLLRRMSLDLAGVLPTIEQLDAAETGDEATLESLRDEVLASEDFEARMVSLLGERWHTRVDEFLITYAEYPEIADDSTQEYAWERMVGEEPLRLMAHVAANDLPWWEIVTADHTMANELMGELWPVDYPEDGDGWELATYTDGRPGAGVLSTNGLWWRYYTTVSNYNRGRAAAIANLLLCQDYLSRPVSFENQVALVDADGIESALRSNPYCVGCHSAIDPLASTLFGFWVANEYNALEMHTYHPEREQLGRLLLDAQPTFYGIPVNGLEQLGEQIALDPRFSRCTAETFASLLWGREVETEDYDRIEALWATFEGGDGTLKPLLRAITDGPVYRAGSLSEAATEAQEEQENTQRLMDATLLSSVLHNLCGFHWTYEGFDQLDNDTYGYRILGGGVDGAYVTGRQRTPSVTWLLTFQRASEGAAGRLSSQVFDDSIPDRVFAYVDGDSVPGDGDFEDELKALAWRLYAVRVDEAWIEQTEALWTEVQQNMGAREAWTAVLAAMMQDPLFTTY